MTELIKYSQIGVQDLNLGTGTFQVTLADGRVVTMDQVSLGEIPGDVSHATVTATGSPTARFLADRFSDWMYIKDYGAIGDGVTDDLAALNAAISAAGAANVVLMINCDLRISNNVTVPSNMGLWFVGNGKLTVDSTKTVTINGPLVTFEGRPIFAGAGSVSITSDQHFAQNNGLIHRLMDRVFVGGAVTNDGRYPNVAKDWLTVYQNTLPLKSVVGLSTTGVTTSGSPVVTFSAGGITPSVGAYFYADYGIPWGAKVLTVDSSTQITLDTNANATTTGATFYSNASTTLSGSGVSASTFGLTSSIAASAIGGLFGSRSSQFTSAGTSCIGLMAYALNDQATYATNAWGLYVEAHRVGSAAGSAKGIEIDVTSTAASEIRPNSFQQSQTAGIQIGAGCGIAGELDTGDQVNIGAAIQIVPNPMQFRTGIMFLASSLEGTDGVTVGTGGRAISMAPGHFIEWHNVDEALVGRIGLTNTDAAKKTEIRFTGNGVQFLGNAGQALGYWFHITSAVNYPELYASVTGSPVILGASGADTNVDLQLTCKGTGVVRFGTWTTNVDAFINGYVTIKDAGGTTRKLATIA